MFTGEWDAQNGKVDMRYSGPTNSQKGVANIDQGNSMNLMTIRWPDKKYGPFVFKKLKLYGFKYEGGDNEFLDESYEEALEALSRGDK